MQASTSFWRKKQKLCDFESTSCGLYLLKSKVFLVLFCKKELPAFCPCRYAHLHVTGPPGARMHAGHLPLPGVLPIEATQPAPRSP
jgi:hypothetical protein